MIHGIYGGFELPPADNADSMSKAITDAARYMPAVNKVFRHAEYMGMSGEDKYVTLCYVLLSENIECKERFLEMLKTSPYVNPIFKNTTGEHNGR